MPTNWNLGFNIIPKTTNTQNLGSSDYKWNIYANSINGTSLSNIITDVQINSVSIVNNGIADIPYASATTPGLTFAGGMGISINSGHELFISKASESKIKEGTSQYMPIVPYNQAVSVFYGLAKAAGDSTQSASSNAVGTYTDSAKTAIKNMLGITAMTGATSSAAGTAGLIPAPSAGDEGKFLKGDGTWGTVGSSGSSVTPISFSIATTDWTLSSGVYTASVINSAITSNSLEIITYDNSIKSLQSDIDTTKDTSTNSIIFSVNTVPSATISGTIYLFTGAVLADTKLNSNQGANNAGKYMKVGADGLLVPDTISIDALPAVTSSDNGKFLCVVNGAWAAVTMQEWQGGSY